MRYQMNPEVKEAWINALLSGEYKQGQARLRTPSDAGDKFCCLGILCDLHSKMTGQGSWGDVDGMMSYMVTGGDHSNAVLPAEVQHWARLPENTGATVGCHHLASMNDSGSTFAEIAEIIKERL